MARDFSAKIKALEAQLARVHTEASKYETALQSLLRAGVKVHEVRLWRDAYAFIIEEGEVAVICDPIPNRQDSDCPRIVVDVAGQEFDISCLTIGEQRMIEKMECGLPANTVVYNHCCDKGLFNRPSKGVHELPMPLPISGKVIISWNQKRS